MKFASIDIETCGLDWDKHSVIEFGAVLEDTSNIVCLENLEFFCRLITHQDYVGTPYALSMHKDIFDELLKKPDERKYIAIPDYQLGPDFRNWLIEKCGYNDPGKGQPLIINVAGKNFGTFDLRFLENIPNFKNNVWFKQRIIDPAVLYYNPELDNELPNLSECKKRAGLDQNGVEHRTISDAMDVISVLRGKLYPYNIK